MIRLSAIILATALAGCASTSQRTVEQLRRLELTQTQMATVEAGVRRALKDPDAARFGSMVAGAYGNGGAMVCGWVNGKNSYGGYSGEKPFMGALMLDGSGTGFSVASIGSSPDDVDAIRKVCASRGLHI